MQLYNTTYFYRYLKQTGLLLLLGGLLFALSTCKKDGLLEQGGAGLQFSTDTLVFDTIFTEKASITRKFKVFNPHNKKLKISQIRLKGGKRSSFRMNVDGIPGSYHEDVIIRPQDSIYIFVEVTINPNSTTSPFVINDAVSFQVNDRDQEVILEAWGQNAHYYSTANLNCQTFETGGSAFTLCELPCNATWDDTKPHVILNNVVIDSGCYLAIKQGADVHFHKNARLFVNGTLIVGDSSGTLDNPVTFDGDRTESFFNNKPGQWGGIHFLPSSRSNQLHNCIIKNGTVGLRIDSLAPNHPYPKLYMTNSIIKNMLSTGILGVTGTISAQNCLVYNCGEHAVNLSLGGIYQFLHCTFATYSNDNIEHEKPVLQAANSLKINQQRLLGPLRAVFTNTIIYGSRDSSEVALHQTDGALFEVIFDHALLKMNDTTGNGQFKSVITGNAPLFESTATNGDYRLKSNSPAIDKGKNTFLKYDLENKMRDSDPDLGAYEE